MAVHVLNWEDTTLRINVFSWGNRLGQDIRSIDETLRTRVYPYMRKMSPRLPKPWLISS